MISKDEWDLLYLFFEQTKDDIRNFDHGTYWPCLIDEFVEF